jgi:hypothetical protein
MKASTTNNLGQSVMLAVLLAITSLGVIVVMSLASGQ